LITLILLPPMSVSVTVNSVFSSAAAPRRALRRTATYGDCWHTTRQTPDFVAQQLPYLRQHTAQAGRDPAAITISLKETQPDQVRGLKPEVRSDWALAACTPNFRLLASNF
jgi:alkanesulfonate monooxygenase SsuD/methylene tetrahydromethanopterin reductase-like flavin-dependent oxidoreductase (luciferase family)